jgi:hypothetical protein
VSKQRRSIVVLQQVTNLLSHRAIAFEMGEKLEEARRTVRRFTLANAPNRPKRVARRYEGDDNTFSLIDTRFS